MGNAGSSDKTMFQGKVLSHTHVEIIHRLKFFPLRRKFLVMPRGACSYVIVITVKFSSRLFIKTVKSI